MVKYTEQDLLCVGKRFNNKKRKYLLINPLQAKHMAVSPIQSLEMMNQLGKKVASRYPDTRLVIGFAETATAIGSVVASSISDDCFYIHSTRENVSGISDWLFFEEEHSHATQQRLAKKELAQWLEKTSTIVLVDDELSTGKTMLNLLKRMKESYPSVRNKKIVIAFIFNHLQENVEKELLNLGIKLEYLVKISDRNFSDEVDNISVKEATWAKPISLEQNLYANLPISLPNSRTGVFIGKYNLLCLNLAKQLLKKIMISIPQHSSLLVVGTEEYMYAALKVGEYFEKSDFFKCVRCQATTRSPIGLCKRNKYPIQSGCKLHSFYDSKRATYIYNLYSYDCVIVFTDTVQSCKKTMEELVSAFPNSSSCHFYLVDGQFRLWCYLPKLNETKMIKSTFKKNDVKLLLKDITNLVQPLPETIRERYIQNGVNYSEMLPLEYKPTVKYMETYYHALREYAQSTADAVAILAEKIYELKGDDFVIVSLARAGTPIGVLLKRYLFNKYDINVEHYSISIIRGKGIDDNAIRYILSKYAPESIQFIDGWIGKGAILRQLTEAVKKYNGISGKLAVVSDPANITDLCGTHEDILIPSSCLNSTVTGLISRTFCRADIIGESDFHGAAFYKQLVKEDMTNKFIDAIVDKFNYHLKNNKLPLGENGISVAKQIANQYNVPDINFIKPGIGETTRVLLRRLPWKILIHFKYKNSDELCHIKQLAIEKGIPIEISKVDLGNYKACGIIRNLSDT